MALIHRWTHGQLLFGTGAYHQHAQQMALALVEREALAGYWSGGVDVFVNPLARRLRASLPYVAPRLARELSRRAVSAVPHRHVRSRWRWELPRVVASRANVDERIVDWLWNRGEHDLDRACARGLTSDAISGFIGVEYGALASLQQCRRLNKRGFVAFTSAHHRTFARTVGRELERFPALKTSAGYFAARDAARSARRDEELCVADFAIANSSFTARSLVEAGTPADRVLTVPLGGPDPVPREALPSSSPRTCRVMYAGTVAVHKGVQYLLRAWRRIAKPGMELHLYGGMRLPDQLARTLVGGLSGSVFTHGSVHSAELSSAYLESSVLVLPTLCDGFGMVVSEALAHGLPVITTANAGAADAIVDGENGFVIPAADEDALAERLSWCVDHPDALHAMRARALASAGRRTWAHFRTHFIDTLDLALSRPSDQARVAS